MTDKKMNRNLGIAVGIAVSICFVITSGCETGSQANKTFFVELPDCCPTPDGMAIAPNGDLYVADFSNNAVVKIRPCGTMFVMAQDGDNNGAGGRLDQPGEPTVWNGRLIVTCFDMVTGPDKVNTRHDKPYTTTSLELR